MVTSKKPWLILFLALIIISGGVLAMLAVIAEENRLREQILTETLLAASGLNTSQILSLSGTESDLTSPVYCALKEQMMIIRNAEPLCRFAYIMGQKKDGTVFFMVDSEPPDSPDYSPPGQEYSEVTPEVLKVFTSGTNSIVGPTTDRWGTWVNGLIPIKNNQTRETIGVFGMDVDAVNWKIHTASAAIPVLFGTLLIIVIILAFVIISKRTEEEKIRLALSEKALKESEARLNAIIQGSPALQFVIDRDHRVVSWNRAIEQYSTISSEEMIGSKNHWKAFYETERPLIADILLDEAFELLPVYYNDSLNHSHLIEGAYEATYFFSRKGREDQWLYVLAAPVRDSEGTIVGALETVVDVTEQHRAEDALAEVVKKLNLLSSVTRHDILNKITFLQTIITLLSEGRENNPDYDDYLKRGIDAVKFIQKQIEFTRTYENIGLNKPEWCDVKNIIHKASFELTHREVAIITLFEGFEVFSDPLIQKVFYNLMDNSIRHGERVTTIRYTISSGEGGIHLTYTDDGIGIPPEDKENIFMKGFGKNSGLGMFLSREILSITHITIREVGDFQKGAKFELFVPDKMFRFTHDA